MESYDSDPPPQGFAYGDDGNYQVVPTPPKNGRGKKFFNPSPRRTSLEEKNAAWWHDVDERRRHVEQYTQQDTVSLVHEDFPDHLPATVCLDLATALQDYTCTISKIVLSEINITGDKSAGISALFHALATSPTIRELQIISIGKIGFSGFRELAKSLREHVEKVDTLQILEVSGTSCPGMKEAGWIAESSFGSDELTSVRFHDDITIPTKVLSLHDEVKELTNYQREGRRKVPVYFIDLSGRFFTNLEAAFVSHTFSCYPKNVFVNVCLNHNEITDSGARVIAEALVNAPQLRSLELMGNQITNIGWRSFYMVLCRKPTGLRELKLQGNKGIGLIQVPKVKFGERKGKLSTPRNEWDVKSLAFGQNIHRGHKQHNNLKIQIYFDFGSWFGLAETPHWVSYESSNIHRNKARMRRTSSVIKKIAQQTKGEVSDRQNKMDIEAEARARGLARAREREEQEELAREAAEEERERQREQDRVLAEKRIAEREERRIRMEEERILAEERAREKAQAREEERERRAIERKAKADERAQLEKEAAELAREQAKIRAQERAEQRAALEAERKSKAEAAKAEKEKRRKEAAERDAKRKESERKKREADKLKREEKQAALEKKKQEREAKEKDRKEKDRIKREEEKKRKEKDRKKREEEKNKKREAEKKRKEEEAEKKRKAKEEAEKKRKAKEEAERKKKEEGEANSSDSESDSGRSEADDEFERRQLKQRKSMLDLKDRERKGTIIKARKNKLKKALKHAKMAMMLKKQHDQQEAERRRQTAVTIIQRHVRARQRTGTVLKAAGIFRHSDHSQEADKYGVKSKVVSVVVSDCGNENANGTFYASGVQLDGSYTYMKVDEKGNRYMLERSETMTDDGDYKTIWVLGYYDTKNKYFVTEYSSDSASLSPPRSNWIVQDGEGPAPKAKLVLVGNARPDVILTGGGTELANGEYIKREELCFVRKPGRKNPLPADANPDEMYQIVRTEVQGMNIWAICGRLPPESPDDTEHVKIYYYSIENGDEELPPEHDWMLGQEGVEPMPKLQNIGEDEFDYGDDVEDPMERKASIRQKKEKSYTGPYNQAHHLEKAKVLQRWWRNGLLVRILKSRACLKDLEAVNEIMVEDCGFKPAQGLYTVADTDFHFDGTSTCTYIKEGGGDDDEENADYLFVINRDFTSASDSKWVITMFDSEDKQTQLYANVRNGWSLKPPPKFWQCLDRKYKPGEEPFCMDDPHYKCSAAAILGAPGPAPFLRWIVEDSNKADANRSGYLLTDAGVDYINGKYIEQRGNSNGGNMYRMENSSGTFTLRQVKYGDATLWIVLGETEQGLENHIYYVNATYGTSPTPPIDGWVLGQHGQEPCPLVVHQKKSS